MKTFTRILAAILTVCLLAGLAACGNNPGKPTNMILRYMGQDVQKQYSELALLERCEALTGTQVYRDGTTEEGLMALVDSLGLGYTATNKDPAYRVFTKENTAAFFQNAIKDGKFVLVRYESPVGYSWKLVIGYDDLGNIKDTLTGEEKDAFGDDVIIFAEPYDGADNPSWLQLG